ncbi:MAG: hypothetical protein ACI8W8_003765 [Rhodothermales bacterium]|jgi:hypothetical protein
MLAVPLTTMTVTEKLELMESLWADLSRNPDDVPMPDWHRTILDERQALIDAGEAKFHDFDKAKARIAARVR